MYFRQQEVLCDYVVKLPDGAYDVGFQKQADGTYAPIFDEWNNYVADKLQVRGPACPMPGTAEERQMAHIGALTREYSRCAAVNAAAEAGYFVSSEVLTEKGEYALEFTN